MNKKEPPNQALLEENQKMDLIVTKEKRAHWGGQVFPCAIGHGGIAIKTQEGDGITPLGSWPIREVFYRADRLEKPITIFPVRAIQKTDGWCDDPRDAPYNQHVQKPHASSHEDLWREDHVYDIIVVLGYNDDPIVSGKGSAIFMHLAREGFSPTAGCIALNLADLLKFLKEATEETRVVVKEA